MKNKISLVFILLYILTGLNAQPKKISVSNGTWSFTSYAANIIKISFTPKGYSTHENITQAVILKALPGQHIPVKVNNESIDVGGKKINAFQKNGYRGFRVPLIENEKIFGGGERALPLNRRGYKFDFYNNPWYGYSEGADNLNFSVPFLTSSNGYALFFDNASRGYADIGKTDQHILEAGFVSGELNVYLITGKDYKEILSSFYKLTGTQPLPPRWAMGNFQSRFGYTSEAQAKQINDSMRTEKIPHDAIIFDLFWFGDSIKGTLGNLDWVNKSKWPDPKKMIGDFKKNHVNTILITEPFILEGTKNYDAAKKYLAVDSAGDPFTLTNFYFGRGGIIDIFRKDAGDWIWKSHYQKQIANGVAGWWTDLGEPEKHPEGVEHNLKDLGFKRLFKADEVHNAYGHFWNKMLSQHYAKDYPAVRLFHLNRSGFAGSQRFSIFPWSGDVSRNWSGLRAQLPVMLGMSMSGIPYIHADAGGFAGGEVDNELYIRWLQFASFTPVFRPHGTALYEVDKNAFSFPSEPALIAAPYRKYAKEVVRQRYAMLPYNYTLAYKQALKAEPLVAPLYYHFPTDTNTYHVGDEFMWGENILVAPILEKAAAGRKLYLPMGTWYTYDGNESIAGGKDTTVKATIDKIPVYVRAGSFITTSANQNVTSTTDDQLDNLVVSYYYDAMPSSTEMYDDNGTSKNAISSRQFQLITFSAMPGKSKLTLTLKTNGGNFKGMPAKRKIKFLVHGVTNPKAILFKNGKLAQELSLQGNEDGSKANCYTFTVDFTGKPLQLEIR